MSNKYKSLAKFFFELGMLSRQKHNGPKLAGVTQVKSLADHTIRAALIGYLLAGLEGANPEKVAVMLLLHDLPETRIGDHHKVSARYLVTDKAEARAFREQLKQLPESLATQWLNLYQEKVRRNTKEGIVAQDADWLETAVSAREYVCLGYKGMQDWIDNVRKALETESAKQLLKEIERADINDWWRGLKRMTYKKLKIITARLRRAGSRRKREKLNLKDTAKKSKL